MLPQDSKGQAHTDIDAEPPPLSFPRSARLLTPKQYQQVFNTASKIHSRAFTALCRPNDCASPRLGMAITKRNLRRAVDRNRVKRWCRESFRQLQHQLPDVDVVILTKQRIAQMPEDELKESMRRLWQKVIKQCAGC